jgi:hypothetical protein
MKQFKNNKVFKILKDRWQGKDMEAYFEDKGNAYFNKLKKELKK